MIAIKRALLSFLSLILMAMLPAGAAMAQVKVTSATPASTYQGTIALDVVIGGSGFDPTAKVQFLVAGTTNPGGVSVKKVVFRSSGELVATIDVPDTANIASYDIVVSLDSGRKGKGTTLFAVRAKSADPCNSTALDFPAFAYRAKVANGSATNITDSTGVCIRTLMTTAASTVVKMAYPVDGTADKGRIVYRTAGPTITALDFTVAPGNTISVLGTRVLSSTPGCCALDISRDGRTVYFSDTDTSVAALDVATLAVNPVYSMPANDSSWFYSYVSANGDGTRLFATRTGSGINGDASPKLVRIDVATDTTPAMETVLRSPSSGGNIFTPSASKTAAVFAFVDYVAGSNNCTPLVIADYDGNPVTPANSPVHYGIFPTWLNDDVLMERRLPPDRKLACANAGTVSRIAPDNTETTLVTGDKPDGR